MKPCAKPVVGEKQGTHSSSCGSRSCGKVDKGTGECVSIIAGGEGAPRQEHGALREKGGSSRMKGRVALETWAVPFPDRRNNFYKSLEKEVSRVFGESM